MCSRNIRVETSVAKGFSRIESSWARSIIVWLRCLPSFHLHHPGGWLHIFIKNVSLHYFIFTSFKYMKIATAVCWKTLLVWCFCDDVQCHLASKQCVYYGHPKSSIVFLSDQTIFSQYFTGLSKCGAANFKPASTCFSFSNGVLVVSVHTDHRGWRHYLFFVLKQVYLLIPGLSKASHK